MSIIFVFFILRNRRFSSLCSLTDFISFSRPVGVVDSSAVSSAYRRSFRWTPWIDVFNRDLFFFNITKFKS